MDEHCRKIVFAMCYTKTKNHTHENTKRKRKIYLIFLTVKTLFNTQYI